MFNKKNWSFFTEKIKLINQQEKTKCSKEIEMYLGSECIQLDQYDKYASHCVMEYLLAKKLHERGVNFDGKYIPRMIDTYLLKYHSWKLEKSRDT